MADSAQGNNTENTAVRKRSCVLGMSARGWVCWLGSFCVGLGKLRKSVHSGNTQGLFYIRNNEFLLNEMVFILPSLYLIRVKYVIAFFKYL